MVAFPQELGLERRKGHHAGKGPRPDLERFLDHLKEVIKGFMEKLMLELLEHPKAI